MAFGSDLVDLFVVGADFYSGSIGKTLKNGWCDFEVLGLEQAPKHFGNDWKLGKAWYFAKRVPQDALKGFEERTRQNIWLRAQGSNVVRLIVDSAQRTKRHDALVAGREFSFRTEAEAVDALRGTVLARRAMVISAGDEQRSLLTFLDEKYDHEQKILLPPDSEVEDIAGKYRLEHDDLEAAWLSGVENDDLWKSYERSRNDRTVVVDWLKAISDSEERRWLYQLLRGRLGVIQKFRHDILPSDPHSPKIRSEMHENARYYNSRHVY